jgi:type III secretory pathway component EscS
MRKHIPLLCTLIMFSLPLFAQNFRGDDYYDDERITFEDVQFSVLIGIPFIVVGYLLSLINAISGLGKVVMWFGIIIAAGRVILFILQAIGDLLSSALNLGLKLAIVGAVIYVAYLIVNGIIQWFRKSA